MADRMRDKAEPARERDDVPPRLGAPEPLPSAPPGKDLPLSALDGPRAASQVMITAARQMHSAAEQIRKAGDR